MNNGWNVIRMYDHFGFAKCVEYGLQRTATPYALKVQHDRVFIEDKVKDVPLMSIFDVLENNPSIRYVGFPTVKSSYEDETQQVKYRIAEILSDCKIDVPLENNSKAPFELLPLMFWYDSNHLCHVQRYLEIFEPFKYAPQQLRKRLSNASLKKLLLKRGDFIEDKFGQAQRNLLVTLSKESADETRAIFNWFGSYLIWKRNSNIKIEADSRIMVRHLRGRKRTFTDHPSEFVTDIIAELNLRET
jgi:hypothetical protein